MAVSVTIVGVQPARLVKPVTVQDMYLIVQISMEIPAVIPRQIYARGMIRAHRVWGAVAKSVKKFLDVRSVGVRNMPFAIRPMAQLHIR